MLKLAEHILQGKAADFDPSQFVDRYEEAVVDILKKKQAGLPVSREHAPPRPQNVVNLMDALRRSIAQEKTASTPPKKGRKRIQGQREMLLPIAGKKGKEAAAKPAERPGTFHVACYPYRPRSSGRALAAPVQDRANGPSAPRTSAMKLLHAGRYARANIMNKPKKVLRYDLAATDGSGRHLIQYRGLARACIERHG
jgi:hypothetical protein